MSGFWPSSAPGLRFAFTDTIIGAATVDRADRV
jgi:hypothetical protein